MSKQEYKKEDFAEKLFEALEIAVQLRHHGYKKQTFALIVQHFPGLRRKANEVLNIPTGPAVDPEVEKKTWVHPDALAKQQQEEATPDSPAPVADKVKPSPEKTTSSDEDSKDQTSRTAGRKSTSGSKRSRKSSRTKTE